MHNVVKWPNGDHTARFLKYAWPFYNIIHERVKFLKKKKKARTLRDAGSYGPEKLRIRTLFTQWNNYAF